MTELLFSTVCDNIWCLKYLQYPGPFPNKSYSEQMLQKSLLDAQTTHFSTCRFTLLLEFLQNIALVSMRYHQEVRKSIPLTFLCMLRAVTWHRKTIYTTVRGVSGTDSTDNSWNILNSRAITSAPISHRKSFHE